jgi:hypothetical protein
MPTDLLEKMREEADSLTADELSQLATELRAKAEAKRRKASPRVTWASLRGTLKTRPGFDAQKWVSEGRREADRTRRVP